METSGLGLGETRTAASTMQIEGSQACDSGQRGYSGLGLRGWNKGSWMNFWFSQVGQKRERESVCVCTQIHVCIYKEEDSPHNSEVPYL